MSEEPEDEFLFYFKRCLAVPELTSLPAEHGARDQTLRRLSRSLTEVEGPFELIDFGCGSGRLIEVFNGLGPDLMKRMTYIGVDLFEDALVKTGQHAIACGFVDKVGRVYLLQQDEFFEHPILAKFIFVIHVLHEVAGRSVAYVLRTLLMRLEQGGRLIIHELEDMSRYPEKDFETWTSEELRTLFGNLPADEFKVEVERYESERARIPMLTAAIEKLGAEITPAGAITRAQYLEVLKGKELRTHQEILKCEETSGTPGRYYAYLVKSHSNIARRILEVEMEMAGEMDQTIRCEGCGRLSGRVTRGFGKDKLGHNDRYELVFEVKCDNCGEEMTIEKSNDEMLLGDQQELIGLAYGRKVKLAWGTEGKKAWGPGGRRWQRIIGWGKDDFAASMAELTSDYLEEARRLDAGRA